MTGSLRGSDSQQNLVGRQPSAARLLPTPVTVSGVSVVSTVWLLATFIIVSALVVAGGFPFWIHNHDPQQLGNQLSRADVGIYYFCYNLSTDQSFRECIPYLQFTPPSNLTHGLEEAELEDIAFLFSSSIVFAFGLGMLVISLVVGVVAYCKPRIKKHSMFVVAFVFQVVGGFALIVSLALFPVSFQSDFLRQICGDGAEYYYRGQCVLDWSLFVAMVATACSLYLPSLAIFSMNISDGLRAHICC